MIFSFSAVHCEISSGRSGFDKDLCRCSVELPDAFLECFLEGIPFLRLLESLTAVDAKVMGAVEAIVLSLFAGEIQLSSGRGFSTDLEGCPVILLMTPVELDRVGMALGEVGFSLNIWDVQDEVDMH